MRPSKVPPHSSVRLLTRGLQNWSIMCWCTAESSTPSSPPALARRAAWAKSPMTRQISSTSMVLQVARCTGSRMPDGDIRVGQLKPSQRERRPMWVIWIMILAPCLCMASARFWKCGMMRSVDRFTELHHCWGLSLDTTDEPPQMARPMPPLAFSS